MLWLRGLFTLIGKFLAGFFTLGFLLLLVMRFVYGVKGPPWGAIVASGVFGFVAFLLLEFYDSILLKLNPTGNELTLYK
jgi:hypothetical protein